MTEDDKGLIRLGGKPFRRVRKHEGAKWLPKQGKAAQGGAGLWCRPCNTRHDWRSKLLTLSYEKRSGVWHLIWSCGKTGQMLLDQPLLNGQVPRRTD